MPNYHFQNKFVSVQIEDDFVRVASIIHKSNRRLLRLLASAPLPNNTIVEGHISKPEVVVSTLRQILQSPGLRPAASKYAVAIIPELNVFLGIIGPVPSNTATEDYVNSEASQHIPFNINEVIIDSTALPGDQSSRQLLFGAVPISVANQYSKIIKTAGLIPIALEPESISLSRVLLNDERIKKTILIVDIGQSRFLITLVQDGIVRFSSYDRSLSYRALLLFISKNLGLSSLQANKALTMFGLDQKSGKGEVRRQLLPFCTRFTNRIREVESFASSHHNISTHSVTELLLTGVGSRIPGLLQFIGEDLRVVTTSPLPTSPNNLQLDRINPADDQLISSYAVIGAALRNI